MDWIDPETLEGDYAEGFQRWYHKWIQESTQNPIEWIPFIYVPPLPKDT